MIERLKWLQTATTDKILQRVDNLSKDSLCNHREVVSNIPSCSTVYDWELRLLGGNTRGKATDQELKQALIDRYLELQTDESKLQSLRMSWVLVRWTCESF